MTAIQERCGLSELMASGPLPQARQEHSTARTRRSRRVHSLTVVVPAKNEAGSLPAMLVDLNTTLRRFEDLEYEVLVIDDGSSDETAVLARACGARVVTHAESLGNGAAVKRGMREARGEWVLMLDADGQHPPQSIPDLLAAAENYDMVIGARAPGSGSRHRNLANAVYNRLASYVTARRIPDLTSGFRLLRTDLAQGFAYLLPNTFSYPTTITLALMRCGYGVGFVPFPVRPREGKSHIRVVKDGARFLLIITRIATFFAPLRVFIPLSMAMLVLGLGWYAYTYLSSGRFTNMSALLLTQATVVFVLGLVSEQVAALRFSRIDDRARR